MKRLLMLAALVAGFLATGLSNTASAYGPPCWCCGVKYGCGCYSFYNCYPNYNLCCAPYGPYGVLTYKGPSVIVPTTGRGYGAGFGLYSGNGMFSGRDVGAWGR